MMTIALRRVLKQSRDLGLMTFDDYRAARAVITPPRPTCEGRISTCEAARRLGLSRTGFRDLRERLNLHGVRRGTDNWFNPDEIDAIARARESAPPPLRGDDGRFIPSESAP
jgi:hypothetical protein